MCCTKTEGWKQAKERSRKTNEEKKKRRMLAYENSPVRCGGCSSALEYGKRFNTYCSRSCSASVNNGKTPKRTSKRKVYEQCAGCGSSVKRYYKYCSNLCANKTRSRKSWERNKLLIEEGKIPPNGDRDLLRRYLIEKFGYVCMECGLTEWKGLPIPLELDHIDGDAGDHRITNIRNVCPNCHAVTPTWKGRNRGRGRKSRGLNL